MDLPSFDELNLIQDPETGLALLAKCPAEETPEQERERLFWQLQFTYWRDWRAGDVAAFARALVDCSLFNMPPPFWLLKAGSELCVRCMSNAEKRARRAMNKALPALEGGEAGARTAPRRSAQLQKEGAWRRCLGGGGEDARRHGPSAAPRL